MKLLLLVLLLLSGGVAHAQSGPRTPEEKAFCRAKPAECAMLKGSNDWVACIRRTLTWMDDGVSDAATIANGVAPLCRSYYNTLMAAITRWNQMPGQQEPLKQVSVRK